MIINGFPDNDLTEEGVITRITDSNRSKKGHIKKPSFDNHGYYHVDLRNENRRKSYRIHRLIAEHFIENPDNLPCVDHINGIRTDNRIENLRWVTNHQNLMNHKGKGYYIKPNGKFRALICVNYKLIHLGTYLTEEEAKQAYQEACTKYKGEFARK